VLNRYCLGIPKHEGKDAELRINGVKPWHRDSGKPLLTLASAGKSPFKPVNFFAERLPAFDFKDRPVRFHHRDAAA
jgi:hypothetical protein